MGHNRNLSAEYNSDVPNGLSLAQKNTVPISGSTSNTHMSALNSHKTSESEKSNASALNSHKSSDSGKSNVSALNSKNTSEQEKS